MDHFVTFPNVKCLKNIERMATTDFVFFNDTIVNKRDVVHIKKVKFTRGCLNQGIRLTMRSNDCLEEWFNDDQGKRNDRFNALVKLLC